MSPVACDVPPCDGSIEKPYDNIFYALMEGWRRVNPYIYSTLEFKLLGNGLDGELERAEFYINKLDYPSDFQYLFRTISSDILIEPSYCTETFTAKGCIKNLTLRPIVFLRTESLYFIVGKLLLQPEKFYFFHNVDGS